MTASRTPPPPPAPFVGREREIAALQRMLSVVPVVAVVGPPGIGKTALVLAALEATGDRETALFVPADDERPALGEGAASRLLEMAEERGAIVVLDGFEATHPDREAVLLALARGARRSRWLVTARTAPTTPTARLRVSPLAADDARTLGTAIGIAEADLPWAVEQSAGAPGRLRRAIERGSAPFALPTGWRPWLRRLVAVPLPLQAPLATGPDDAGDVDHAVAQGVVTQLSEGLWLDPVVRADVREEVEPLSRAEKAALAEALASAGALAAGANALTLWLELGEHARALELLDARGDALLESPVVSEVWRRLSPVAAPELRRWRFRVAVAAGAVGEVDVDEVPDDDLALRCDRAHLLLLRGRSEAARVVADGVLDALASRSDDGAAFRAVMVSAAASLNLREADAALRVLDRAPPASDVDRVSHDAVRAKALAAAGRELEGRAVLDDLRALATRLAPELTQSARARLAGACLDLDDRRLARHLLPDPREAAESALGPDVTRAIEVAHACIIALDDGRLADVAPIAELQATAPVEDSLVSTHLRLIRAEWLVAVGRFAEARIAIADVAPRVKRSDNADWVRMLQAQVDMATGTPPPSPLAVSSLGDVAPAGVIAQARHALRWGAGPASILPSHTLVKARTHRCLPLQLRAEHHLVHGELDDARYDAARACHEADRFDYQVILADALLTRADVSCVAGDWSACREAAERLLERAREIGSPRWDGDARLYLGALDQDWGALEALAAAQEPSPVAARRARALLGDTVELDAIDARVVASIRRREEWPAVTVCGHAEAGWGVDVERARAWTAGGWVDIDAQTRAWRVLETLALEGGRASSASLLGAVWGVERYRPDRHDNRLQVTMYRLRSAVGDSAGSRIVRDGDGYALVGRCRIVGTDGGRDGAR